MTDLRFRPSLKKDIFRFAGLALVSGLIFCVTQGMISKQIKSSKTAMKVWKIEKSIQKGIAKLPYGSLSLHGLVLIFGAFVATRTLTTSIRLDPATIRIDEGIIVRRMESISFTAVKDHEITTNLIEQILGICTLHIISSDKTSPLLRLRGMPKGLANDVYDFMRLNAANSVVELVKINEAKIAERERN